MMCRRSSNDATAFYMEVLADPDKWPAQVALLVQQTGVEYLPILPDSFTRENITRTTGNLGVAGTSRPAAPTAGATEVPEGSPVPVAR